MSIIAKALRKAQEERAETKGNIHTEPTPPPAGISLEKASTNDGFHISRKHVPVIALSSVLLLLLLLLAGSWFTRSGENTNQTASVDQTKTKAVTQPVEPAPKKSLSQLIRRTPSSSTRKNLPEVSGVMYTPSAPKAIVGGRMVEEGSTVNGLTIKQILPNKVIATDGTSEFELKVR